jgi:glyoxylase-like metal-dependent hydrolase (beta-lactamase superfamily II)
LAGSLAVVVQASLPLPAAAAEASAQLTQLGEGLWVLRGFGAPVVVAENGGQLLLIDGGDVASAKPLSRFLSQQFPRAKLSALINTSWRPQRSGYNETAAAAGARIIAHENTRLWLGTEVHCGWESRVYAPRPARALPTETVRYGSRTLVLGGQQVEYGVLPNGHTDGDLYVWLPAHDVLVAGDMAVSGRYPIVDYSTNGWLGGMVGGLKQLMARCGPQTRVIDADGTVIGKAQLLAQQDLCFAVLQRIAESYYKGETRQQFLDSKPSHEFDAARGDPTRFLVQSYESAWGHINEIRRVTR